MTTIRTSCPGCGEVEMPAAAVLLSVLPGTQEGTYSFVCPSCEKSIEKPADSRVVLMLRSAGVEIIESDEALETTPDVDAPPLTFDDLIDFHFLLEQDDFLDELLQGA